jgi:hypothetical protein
MTAIPNRISYTQANNVRLHHKYATNPNENRIMYTDTILIMLKLVVKAALVSRPSKPCKYPPQTDMAAAYPHVLRRNIP